MKKLAFLMCFLIPFVCLAQIDESFNDGDFTCSPTWNTSNLGSDFLIINNVLRSNSSSPNNSFFLSTPNKLAMSAQWQIKARSDISTSGSNYTDIYIISDRADLKASTINGYFVRIGDTSDDISLFKRTGSASTSTKIIDGLNGSISPSDSSILLRVVRDAAGQFTLQRKINTGEIVTEGVVTDTAIKASEFFGILIQQSTASFFYKHFFDDIQVAALQDSDPPSLLSIKARDGRTLHLNFSEVMDTATVKDLSNYLFDGQTFPSGTSIHADPGDLAFSIRLPEELAAGSHTIDLFDLEDRTGNIIRRDTISFDFILPYTPSPGDIVISEILADPSPPVGLPDHEFVELYNATNAAIQLEGWTYSDLTTSYTFGKNEIGPGEYLILTSRSDTSHFTQFARVIGVSPWPSLNNSGDLLKLRSPDGSVIDSVSYSDTWYTEVPKKAGGWTLERALDIPSCESIVEWTASKNAKGGTPGNPGSISGRLLIDSVLVINEKSLRISFNIRPDTASIQLSSFRIADNVQPSMIHWSGSLKELTLIFDEALESGKSYTLNANGIKDCEGRSLDSAGSKLNFLIANVIEIEYPLVINEIFADPSPTVGMPEAEFIELYNPTTHTVYLKGLTYGNLLKEFTFSSDSIAAGEFLLLCPEKDTLLYKTHGRVLGIPAWPAINNAGATLLLKNNKGRIIHHVTFDINWYRNNAKKNGGYSLELIDPASQCDPNQNWKLSEAAQGATPGKKNSVYAPFGASAPIKINRFEITDEVFVRVFFENSVNSSSAEVPGNYSLNNGAGSPQSAKIYGPEFKEVVLRYLTPLARSQTYTLTLSGISDCGGRSVEADNSRADYFYPSSIRAGDILISEILFNPRRGGVDFLEIYNNTRETLNLQELYAGRATDATQELRKISADPLLFKPGDYLALTIDPDKLEKEYRVIDKTKLRKVNLPQFNDNEGIVVLASSNLEIERFKYSAGMHFPLYKSHEGISLERSSYVMAANAPGNFRSAAAAVGFATPGSANSQMPSLDEASTKEFQILNTSFSPDNDGFDDLLSIAYNLGGAGYVADVRIYNDRGAAVKTLMSNVPLAASGTISWDGRNDSQSTAAPGIYILDMNLFDLDGNKKRFRKAFALSVKF